MAQDESLEVREVRSEDPSLTPEANRLLTEEARRAVGADAVRVPRRTAHAGSEEHGGHSSVATEFAMHRILIAITFFALLVTGAIVSISTGSWLAVVVACVVHAVGTFFVLTMLATATGQTEHVDPSVAARLNEEGVADPDAQLSDLVQEFAGVTDAHGPGEQVASGASEQPADPHEQPAQAAAQQRTAMTPAGSPTEPAGDGSALDWVLLRGLAGALLVLALAGGALAPWLGVRMLAIPAVIVPAVIAWLVLQRRMDSGKEEQDGERSGTTEGASRKALAGAVAVVVLVGTFVALVGWLGDLV